MAHLKEVPLKLFCPSYSSSHNFAIFFNCPVFFHYVILIYQWYNMSMYQWNFFYYLPSNYKTQSPVLPCLLSSCPPLGPPDWKAVPINHQVWTRHRRFYIDPLGGQSVWGAYFLPLPGWSVPPSLALHFLRSTGLLCIFYWNQSL